MTPFETKAWTARTPATVVRYEKRRYIANVSSAGSHGVHGEGATEAEARADLEKNLAWVSHFVGAEVAHDAAGQPFVCTVGAYHGAWIVRRCTLDASGMSGCVNVVSAPSWSALKTCIATWNVPND